MLSCVPKQTTTPMPGTLNQATLQPPPPTNLPGLLDPVPLHLLSPTSPQRGLL
ncbi:hypothetical protein COCC4DRAFT_35211, partial [Bipolaris maydis ATCC 48331]